MQLLLVATTTSAQPATFWAPERAQPGDLVTAFVDLTGSGPIDGLSISAGVWEVVSVTSIDRTASESERMELDESIHGLLARPATRLVGRHRFAVVLRAPEREVRASSISVLPFYHTDGDDGQILLDPQHEAEFDITLDDPTARTGRAFRLDAVAQTSQINLPVEIGGTGQGFGIAFWLKTSHLDQMIFSSWDGQEHSDYAFEFVVSPAGELRVYSGSSGVHHSLGSGRPIADGTWHHVGYSFDPTSGKATLVIDGDEADSRFVAGIPTEETRSLSFGRRPSADHIALIDEVVILNRAVSAVELGKMSRVPVDKISDPSSVLVLGFETQRSRSLVGRWDDEDTFPSSGLVLHSAASDLVAVYSSGAVTLSWTIERAERQIVTVERSSDGVEFLPIHTLTVQESPPGLNDLPQSFEFTDLVGDASPIHFYRIRQNFDDASMIESSLIKIGSGAVELPQYVELLGGSPNPFSTSTSVILRVNEPIPLRLSVWSISGRMVDLLASETLQVGVHRLPFSPPADTPSGTYFVRLEAEDFVQTKKIIFQR